MATTPRQRRPSPCVPLGKFRLRSPPRLSRSKAIVCTVAVRRRRVEHKADGSTEVPSAHAWQTPRQVALTPGLRDAACDGTLHDSAQQTVAPLETHADEVGLLAKPTVLEIVHDQGEQLQAAAHTRAQAVYARDPEALRLLVPAPPEVQPSVEIGVAAAGDVPDLSFIDVLSPNVAWRG